MRFTYLLLLLLPLPVCAQGLEVDPNYDAERLIKEVFSSGQCETIFNIQRIGSNPDGIGFFQAPDSIVGFDRGIIISTGSVSAAPGPNSDTDVGSELEGDVSDPDLDIASTGNVFDAAGIEFDFIPLQPTVTFRYVFASEEYCEFVGATFNDIFGFFISGPGLNGPYNDNAVNLATIPGTTQAVSINNVNYGENENFYLDNEFPSVRLAAGCGGDNTPGPRFEVIEYDGQTVILTATVELQICSTYHIRLVVGDVQDSNLDSAVFLEAGSFDLGGSVTLEPEDTTRATVVYEGCAPTNFRVQRGEDSNPDREQTIAYRIGNNSAATQGVDFTAGSGSVTILAGEDFAEIPLVAFADGIAEGLENVWLYLDIPCACYTDSIELFIDEPGVLNVGLDEAFYCPNETATLRPRVSGGAPPYVYAWSFGSTDAVPELTPPLPASIDLTVTDACGQSISSSIGTFSSPPPELILPQQNLRACRNEEQSILMDLTGNAPITVTYSLNNGPEETWVFNQAGPQSVPIDRGGNYRVLSVEDQACRIDINEALRADFYKPSINPRLENPSCFGRDDGSVSVTHLPTVQPYTYEWTGLSPTGLEANNLVAGTYALKVTDALGCSDERDLSLRDPDALMPVDITCNQVRRPPLMPSAGGGRPPYEYSVDGVNFFGNEGFAQLEEGQYYQLRIRDAVGCATTQPNFFWPTATPRPVRLPTFVPQELAGSTQVDAEYFVPRDQILTYQWYPADIFDCPSCPAPVVSAPRSQTISLVVENIFGCRDSLVTSVAVDGRVPVFVPNIFTPDGDGTNDFVPIYASPLQVERVLSFRLFNRWGAQLWEDLDFVPNDARRGWDGYLNGQLASVAVYIWIAEVRLTTGELQVETGTVVLMR
jgi:gliding motility-associated-like protein